MNIIFPPIVTFQAVNAPKGQEWLAQFRVWDGRAKRAIWHPVLFRGATEEAVTEAAEKWWTAQVEEAREAVRKSKERWLASKQKKAR